MDDKLKEAIATVRTGDRREAQRQLIALLENNPGHAQGWYLLSLIVDSPDKQATYLSKTLALDPTHEKAKQQLENLQSSTAAAPAGASPTKSQTPMDVIAQSETDELPDWLQQEEGVAAGLSGQPETAAASTLADDPLPDWLQEPTDMSQVAADDLEAELPAVAGETAVSDSMSGSLETQVQSPIDPQKSSVPTRRQSRQKSTRALNVILGILIILAVVVMVLLGYLLLS